MTTLYIITFFIIGLFLGSFYNVVGYRLPIGKSIVTPPSHCPKCNHRLSFVELLFDQLTRHVVKRSVNCLLLLKRLGRNERASFPKTPLMYRDLRRSLRTTSFWRRELPGIDRFKRAASHVFLKCAP